MLGRGAGESSSMEVRLPWPHALGPSSSKAEPAFPAGVHALTRVYTQGWHADRQTPSSLFYSSDHSLLRGWLQRLRSKTQIKELHFRQEGKRRHSPVKRNGGRSPVLPLSLPRSDTSSQDSLLCLTTTCCFGTGKQHRGRRGQT